MKKILALILLFSFIPQSAFSATVIFLTSGTSFSTPSDWTTTNDIECIGSGGNGRIGTGSLGKSGGGGGAYAKVSNLALSGSIAYVVASGGSQSDTYFNGAASSTASLSCAGGKNATSGAVGAGGTVVDSTGTVEYAGGSGGTGAFCEASTWDGTGGGAGGAGGPFGAGVTGDNADSGSPGAGGAGGAGFGGAGGSSLGDPGGSGFEISGAAGSGGGGAGGAGSGNDGAQGGAYGGGGGGGGGGDGSIGPCIGASAGGAGVQGIIVVTYWPTLSSMIKILGGKTIIQGGGVRIY